MTTLPPALPGTVLRILATTDLGAHTIPLRTSYGRSGTVAGVVELLDRERERGPAVWLDVGDLVVGSPAYPLTGQRPWAEVAGLPIAASAAGNHEFAPPARGRRAGDPRPADGGWGRGIPGRTGPMGGYSECQARDIDATPQACFDALTDYERLPEWQGTVKSIEVLERDAEGRGTIVAYEIDARIKTVRYRLRQVYEEPRRVASEYLGGDFRDFSGEWRFLERDGGGTRAELDLRIDPGRFVPGPLRSAISDAVMRRALKDLKAHVESTRAGTRRAPPARRRAS